MYKIDLHNYEAYLLDFSEGNLSDENQMELELFLIQHPELNIDLTELSLLLLEEEPINFSNKTNLKKSETDLISESQFIAYIENQLSNEERLGLEKSCEVNSSLSKELTLFAATIVKADTTVVYENKQSLKRKPKVVWFNFSITQYAAAACVVFLLGLFMLWPKTGINSGLSTLANKKDVVKAITTQTANTSNSPKVNELSTLSKEPNQDLAQRLLVNTTQQALANNTNTIQNNIIISQDSLHKVTDNLPVVESLKNEGLIALNVATVTKQQTVVQVITENEDEQMATNTDIKKKGIWATASRALKNLNHAGVKGVNGDEENSNENTSYAITLGGINITHKAGL